MRHNYQQAQKKGRHRRSKFELIIDILLEIKKGNKKPTHITSRANISYPRLKKLLKDMSQMGLLMETEIRDNKDNRCKVHYKITSQGESVITYFVLSKNNVYNILDILE